MGIPLAKGISFFLMYSLLPSFLVFCSSLWLFVSLPACLFVTFLFLSLFYGRVVLVSFRSSHHFLNVKIFVCVGSNSCFSFNFLSVFPWDFPQTYGCLNTWLEGTHFCVWNKKKAIWLLRDIFSHRELGLYINLLETVKLQNFYWRFLPRAMRNIRLLSNHVLR